jgi:choline dehydrogenase-like flavoprotein
MFSRNVTYLPFQSMAYGTQVDWQIYTVPQTYANNRVFRQVQGKLLGGTSAINGAIYVRPSKEEFDGLEALGQTGWYEPYHPD